MEECLNPKFGWGFGELDEGSGTGDGVRGADLGMRFFSGSETYVRIACQGLRGKSEVWSVGLLGFCIKGCI